MNELQEPSESDKLVNEILGEEPAVVEGEAPEAEPKPKPKVEEDWAVPGKYKTVDDVRRELPKQERYRKNLEIENKKLRAIALGLEPPTEKEAEPKEDFLADPEGTVKKIAERNQRYTEDQLKQMRGEIIVEGVQEEYPNFNIKMNEDKIKEALLIYSPEYIAANSKKLLRETIEKLGGKKAARQDYVAPYTEEGGAPGAGFKAGTVADKIVDSIVKAEINDCDVFK